MATRDFASEDNERGAVQDPTVTTTGDGPAAKGGIISSGNPSAGYPFQYPNPGVHFGHGAGMLGGCYPPGFLYYPEFTPSGISPPMGNPINFSHLQHPNVSPTYFPNVHIQQPQPVKDKVPNENKPQTEPIKIDIKANEEIYEEIKDSFPKRTTEETSAKPNCPSGSDCSVQTDPLSSAPKSVPVAAAQNESSPLQLSSSIFIPETCPFYDPNEEESKDEIDYRDFVDKELVPVLNEHQLNYEEPVFPCNGQKFMALFKQYMANAKSVIYPLCSATLQPDYLDVLEPYWNSERFIFIKFQKENPKTGKRCMLQNWSDIKAKPPKMKAFISTIKEQISSEDCFSIAKKEKPVMPEKGPVPKTADLHESKKEGKKSEPQSQEESHPEPKEDKSQNDYTPLHPEFDDAYKIESEGSSTPDCKDIPFPILPGSCDHYDGPTSDHTSNSSGTKPVVMRNKTERQSVLEESNFISLESGPKHHRGGQTLLVELNLCQAFAVSAPLHEILEDLKNHHGQHNLKNIEKRTWTQGVIPQAYNSKDYIALTKISIGKETGMQRSIVQRFALISLLDLFKLRTSRHFKMDYMSKLVAMEKLFRHEWVLNTDQRSGLDIVLLFLQSYAITMEKLYLGFVFHYGDKENIPDIIEGILEGKEEFLRKCEMCLQSDLPSEKASVKIIWKIANKCYQRWDEILRKSEKTIESIKSVQMVLKKTIELTSGDLDDRWRQHLEKDIMSFFKSSSNWFEHHVLLHHLTHLAQKHWQLYNLGLKVLDHVWKEVKGHSDYLILMINACLPLWRITFEGRNQEDQCKRNDIFTEMLKKARKHKGGILDLAVLTVCSEIMNHQEEEVCKTMLQHLFEISKLDAKVKQDVIQNMKLFNEQHVKWCLLPLGFAMTEKGNDQFSFPTRVLPEAGNVTIYEGKFANFPKSANSPYSCFVKIFNPVIAKDLLPRTANDKQNIGERIVQNEINILFKLQKGHQGKSSHLIELLVHVQEENVRPTFSIFGCSLDKVENLSSFLVRNPRVSQNERIDLVLNILKAVEFCHSKGIVHRDITAFSCIVGRNKEAKLTCKLASFELAQECGENEEKFGSSEDRIPTLWSDPLSLYKSRFSHKTDHYMLGMTIIEVLGNGIHPYSEMMDQDTNTKVELLFKYRLYPERMAHIPEPLYVILMNFLVWEHNNRPTIARVKEAIETYRKKANHRSKHFSVKEYEHGLGTHERNYLKNQPMEPKRGYPDFLQKNHHDDIQGYLEGAFNKETNSWKHKLQCTDNELNAADDPCPDGNEHMQSQLLTSIEDKEQENAILNLKHENIAKVIRIHRTSPGLTMVWKFENMTSILSYLSKKEFKVSETEMMKYYRQIAQAVKYLHENNLIHCCICARFVYLCEDETTRHPVAKLGHLARCSLVRKAACDEHSDEVLVRPFPPGKEPKNMMRLSPKEVNETGYYSMKSDVYQYGTFVYEVEEARAVKKKIPRKYIVPYAHVKQEQILKIQRERKPLPKPETCTDHLYNIIRKSTLDPAYRRPSICEIIHELDQPEQFSNHEPRNYEKPKNDSGNLSSKSRVSLLLEEEEANHGMFPNKRMCSVSDLFPMEDETKGKRRTIFSFYKLKNKRNSCATEEAYKTSNCSKVQLGAFNINETGPKVQLGASNGPKVQSEAFNMDVPGRTVQLGASNPDDLGAKEEIGASSLGFDDNDFLNDHYEKMNVEEIKSPLQHRSYNNTSSCIHEEAYRSNLCDEVLEEDDDESFLSFCGSEEQNIENAVYQTTDSDAFPEDLEDDIHKVAGGNVEDIDSLQTQTKSKNLYSNGARPKSFSRTYTVKRQKQSDRNSLGSIEATRVNIEQPRPCSENFTNRSPRKDSASDYDDIFHQSSSPKKSDSPVRKGIKNPISDKPFLAKQLDRTKTMRLVRNFRLNNDPYAKVEDEAVSTTVVSTRPTNPQKDNEVFL